MERVLRLEVAKQKSLHGVWDMVAEKCMRRFGMISTWHYNRIIGVPGIGVELQSWKEAPVSAYSIICFDPQIHSWMTIWSTVLRNGTPEELWAELELFAYDFKRDTVLLCVDDDGNIIYRLFRPDNAERAQIKVNCDGTVETENIERFVINKAKKKDKNELTELSGKYFTDKGQACSFIEKALKFTPHGELTIDVLLDKIDELDEPFRVMQFALDPEYLSYDRKREYAKLLESVERFLFQCGFQKSSSGSNFFRILDDGMYMQCLNFQKRRLELDRKYDTTFTVNVAYGQGTTKWVPSDFKTMNVIFGGERIGHITRGIDYWYELHPGADTQKVIDELLTDIQRVIVYIEEKWTVYKTR